MEEDSDIAFKLQVEEALSASLLEDSISSPDSSCVPYDAVFGAALSNLLQNDHLYKYEQELLDQYKAEVETKLSRLDLSRQIHDRAFACEIANVPEAEWSKTGDYLNRPFGEGSSSSDGQGLGFRVYVKGLVEGLVGGIGVAICDGNDGLVFELGKGLSGKEHQVNGDLVELKALIEGLDLALLLDLKRVTIVTDNSLIYQYITGKNSQIMANATTLSDQINLLLRKFTRVRASLVTSKDIKLAVELARNAMAFQVNRPAGNTNTKNLTKGCAICLEDKYVDQMFLITGCRHSYCFSCMSKHVQFKLLQGILPTCPHEHCKSELKLDSCKQFLTPELFDIMSQRVKEASIPAADMIYCPYPRCSTLLSKTELQGPMGSSNVDELLCCRKCQRCGCFFCINCKVPWHSNMSCFDFKRLNPYPSYEDKKLKSLASQNLWRQCPKCNHMVSLEAGCYHIYCRCGHEFCYTCGAEWKNKRATCTCPIWDERNIVYDEQNRRGRR
ncbi:putative E3 ubiquitin ligase [Handroanthus impetiginosus]|uniref:RBR-type E3 ubiquitin transferase n=1 Tax=Handroanthus impetiginosus TaxID=429701 RepID=A0A2G9GB92_9LAMI|nr:putative E3 ubiquitin ligase [Handroanthus impetiginosus]